MTSRTIAATDSLGAPVLSSREAPAGLRLNHSSDGPDFQVGDRVFIQGYAPLGVVSSINADGSLQIQWSVGGMSPAIGTEYVRHDIRGNVIGSTATWLDETDVYRTIQVQGINSAGYCVRYTEDGSIRFLSFFQLGLNQIFAQL